MRNLGIMLSVLALAFFVGCGNGDDESGDSNGDPAGGTPPELQWPDVDCGGGMKAIDMLEQIKSLASAAGKSGIVGAVDACMTHPVGDRAVHCKHVADALAAANNGDWEACSTELGHGTSGG